jgi:hypothetical protein
MVVLCYKDKERLREARSEIENIKSIDGGVREYLRELNSLGYLTHASCSGLISEHKKMKNWSKRINKDLNPGVSILVKRRNAKRTLFNLQQTLHGTGWNAEYSITYRCYRDGREIPFHDGKHRYLKRTDVYYVPIHINYNTKCDDRQKRKAWNVLIQLLQKNNC